MKFSFTAAAAATALVAACAQLAPTIALADPEPTPEPVPADAAPVDPAVEPAVDPAVEPVVEPVTGPTAAPGQDLRNVTYRARVDGVARGALITYKLNDEQVQSVDPTMLPGRTFEAQTVLSNADLAGMQVSIQWPYSANLHCEVLVDDAIVAQADEFIKPRLTPADDEPDYGKLTCGAPLVNPTGNVVNTDPVEAVPPAGPGADPVVPAADPAPEAAPAA